MLKTGVVFSSEHGKIYCTVGWVDIGTRARVPLRIVVYLQKSRENDKKLVFSSNHFSVGPGHTVQYTI
jgi:hypothetical protein